MNSAARASQAILDAACPIRGGPADYDALLEWTGDAKYVFLGEASHGTSEFFKARATLTRRLIEEKGFLGVAIEADWPDAYAINRYVRGWTKDPLSASSFQRFPSWMWRNEEAHEFTDWLRSFNATRPPHAPRVGFYGIDTLSLGESAEAMIRYLEVVAPDAAATARKRYSVLERYQGDWHAYGYAVAAGMVTSSECAVRNQLDELQKLAFSLRRRFGKEGYFCALQNARVVANAEEYYRLMFAREGAPGNVRQEHMANTLQAVSNYIAEDRVEPKIVVWAHNSHSGDSRATELANAGEMSLGQLARARYGDRARLIGFTTYSGTVTAASGWGSRPKKQTLRPAIQESYEALFHEAATHLDAPDFFLLMDEGNEVSLALGEPRLERVISGVYSPEQERQSHYFTACLPEQFDAILHFDETKAIRPSGHDPEWEATEASASVADKTN